MSPEDTGVPNTGGDGAGEAPNPNPPAGAPNPAPEPKLKDGNEAEAEAEADPAPLAELPPKPPPKGLAPCPDVVPKEKGAGAGAPKGEAVVAPWAALPAPPNTAPEAAPKPKEAAPPELPNDDEDAPNRLVLAPDEAPLPKPPNEPKPEPEPKEKAFGASFGAETEAPKGDAAATAPVAAGAAPPAPPPIAAILRSKSAPVGLMPWVSQGRAEEAGFAAVPVAAGAAPPAPPPGFAAGAAAGLVSVAGAKEKLGAGLVASPAAVEGAKTNAGAVVEGGDANESAFAATNVGDAPLPNGEPLEAAADGAAAGPELKGDAAAGLPCCSGSAPAAPILRAKSASVDLMPCVSQGRAKEAAGPAALLADLAAGAGEAVPKLKAAVSGGALAPSGDCEGWPAAPAAAPPELAGAPNLMPPVPVPNENPPPPAGAAATAVAAFGFFVSHEMHFGMPSSLITRHTAHRHSFPSGSSFGGLKFIRFAAVSSSSELPISASESSESTSDSFSSTNSSFEALPLPALDADLLGLFTGEGEKLAPAIEKTPSCFFNSAENPMMPALPSMRAISSTGTGFRTSLSAISRVSFRPGTSTLKSPFGARPITLPR